MKLKFLVLFSILSLGLFSQRMLGSWNDYLSYKSVYDITENETTLFAACENSLFTYDLEDHSINRYSSVNGLSDIGVTSIQWNEATATLVIGYENGNIDFLTESGIVNFSDIKRSGITTDKSIKDIYNDGYFIWVSTGFGIVKVDLEKREVVETYIIGSGGNEIKVSNIIIFDDYVYAATAQGLLKAPLLSSLQDYNNWIAIDDLPNVNYDLVFENDGVLGVFQKTNSSHKIFLFMQNQWEMVQDDMTITDVNYSNGQLQVLRYNWIQTRNSTFELLENVLNYSFTDDKDFLTSYVDTDGKLWIGDGKWGLVEYLSEDQNEYYQPEGPDNNNIWKISTLNDNLWIAHGGLSATVTHRFSQFYMSGYYDGSWTNYREDDYLTENGVFDIIDVAIHPNNPDQVYFASWNGGLLEKKTDGSLQLYHEGKDNSIIHSLDGSQNYRVGGIDFDPLGNLWLTNSNDNSSKQLIVRKPDGSEISYDCPSLGSSSKILDLIHTTAGQLWVVNGASQNGRLFVYDYNETIDDKNDDDCKKINTGTNNGGLPTNDVLCVAEDLDGEIWIGTTEGPAIIYTPEFMFDNNPPQALQIKIKQDGNVEIVLSTATITAIAVDGANRKWLGTTNSGVFLLSEDGTEQILHFTKENSPLLDNNIRDININAKSGEVFFATDKGLISYINDATLGGVKNECYAAFPNPVRPDYYGPVVIDGLVRDSQVKITDVYGNLVYDTVSNGGRVVWDTRNFSGDRVQSGVYLALITSVIDSRETSCITKIMVIN